MKKNISILFVCLVVFFGMMCSMPAQAKAAKLEWHTTNLYYHPNKNLVIEGYFRNNTNKHINYIHEFNLTAFITQGGSGYTKQVNGTFRNFEKMIAPYGESYHKFRIRNVQRIRPVARYKVNAGYIRWKYSNAAG